MGKFTPFKIRKHALRQNRTDNPMCYIGEKGEQVHILAEKMNVTDIIKALLLIFVWLGSMIYTASWIYVSASVNISVYEDEVTPLFVTQELPEELGGLTGAFNGTLGWILDIFTDLENNTDLSLENILNETMTTPEAQALLEALFDNGFNITDMDLDTFLEYLSNGTLAAILGIDFEDMVKDMLTAMITSILPSLIPSEWFDPIYLTFSNPESQIPYLARYLNLFTIHDMNITFDFNWANSTVHLINGFFDEIKVGAMGQTPFELGTVLTTIFGVLTDVLINVTYALFIDGNTESFMDIIFTAFTEANCSFELYYTSRIHYFATSSRINVNLSEIMGWFGGVM